MSHERQVRDIYRTLANDIPNWLTLDDDLRPLVVSTLRFLLMVGAEEVGADPLGITDEDVLAMLDREDYRTEMAAVCRKMAHK